MKILRIILSVGAGFLVVTALGSFLCLCSYPIVSPNCIPVDIKTYGVLEQAGFLTEFAGGALGGCAVYLLTGKWKTS